MNTMGIKSSNTSRTLGNKGNKSSHTLGMKTNMVIKNSNPSAYTSDSNIIENQNLSEYEPLGVNSNKISKAKSKLER